MSQIASFTYLKASDVPFLGFWSKPKPRLFRKPESKFDELLRQKALRESVFEDADGVYVALVFAWLESRDGEFANVFDPVLKSLRKHDISTSHWLVKSADLRLISLLEKPLSESDWPAFLRKNGVDDGGQYAWASFDDARRFVRDRLSEVQPAEALLVAVG